MAYFFVILHKMKTHRTHCMAPFILIRSLELHSFPEVLLKRYNYKNRALLMVLIYIIPRDAVVKVSQTK